MEKLEKIVKPLEREGYDIGGIISNRIKRIQNKSTEKDEVYNLMKETDELLLVRGFPFVCMNIYDDEISTEFNVDVSPYLDLGKFEEVGLDTQIETENFIRDFIENYEEYMYCVWEDDDMDYFEYNIGGLSSDSDSSRLWIEDGVLCRQIKRTFYNYEWPVEKYQINNPDELNKLAQILQPDIRLINYAQAYRTQE